MRLYVTVHAPGYVGAFAVDDRGELLETVEFADGEPDWDSAGVCDPRRGSNPELQQALRDCLSALADEYQGQDEVSSRVDA